MMQRDLKNFRFHMIVILCLNLSQFSVLSADLEDNIVILSSDMSDNNCQIAQNAFKETFCAETFDIDLGKKLVTEKQVLRLIRDIDPDLVYCIGSKAYLLAYKYLRNKNLILTSADDSLPIQLSENTFGVVNELHAETQLTFFRYFFPEVERIGVLYSERYNMEWVEQAKSDGNDIGIEIISRSISQPREINQALLELLPNVDVIWLISDPIVLAESESIENIFAQCDARMKSIFTNSAAFADFGAVMVISADIPTIGRQAAGMAKAILASTMSLDEQLHWPAGSSITLNMKKIDEYGVTLNIEALDSVNDLVQ